jgi:hypothetical protein
MQSNVDAIICATAFTSLKLLRSFLGICNLYRKLIEMYSDVAKHLNLLLRNDARFEWTSECKLVFEKLKTAITSAPTLDIFDLSLPTVLTSNASLDNLSALISKTYANGSKHPVAFVSWTIKNAKQNFSAGERVALAFIF